MRCQDCGIGLAYYSCTEHSRRQSCSLSVSGYHYFVSDTYYLIYTVYHTCWKKSKKHAGYPMQAPLRDRVPDTETD